MPFCSLRSSSEAAAGPRAATRPRAATHLRAAVALLTAATAGCGVPDRPAGLAGELPGDVREWLTPDTVRTARLAEGVVYRFLWSAEGPWALHLVEAELDRCTLGIEVVPAPGRDEGAGARARVTEMVERHPRRVVVAVNGDFFTPEGRPIGPEIAGGVVRSARARPALVWQGGRTPLVARLGVENGRVSETGGRIEWPIDTLGVGGVQMIGGFPELLDGGARIGDLGVRDNPVFSAQRHPRTAVGWDHDGRRLWLVVADGRQGAWSTGMTLPELARLLEGLGVDEGLNLDGGGSSVMIVADRAVSRPSDETGERPVVNALLLVEDDGFCPPLPSAVSARRAAP